MTKVTNNDIPRLVRGLDLFKTGNETVFAEQRGGRYCVFSYGDHFPLLVVENGKYFVNKDKYSVTTSHHANLVRRGIPDWVDIQLCPTETMLVLVSEGVAGATAARILNATAPDRRAA